MDPQSKSYLLCKPLRKKKKKNLLCGSLFTTYPNEDNRQNFVLEILSSFQLLHCYKGGKSWSSMVVFLLFQFHYIFLSFFPSFSLRSHLFLCIFSFFLSFPQQTETTEIKENSSTKWGWLQGMTDHEPRLANAPISRPLLSSATNSCSALNSFGPEIHKYLKPLSISFLKIFKS